MKRALTTGIVLVFAITVTGCGGNSEADAYYKGYIDAQNELATSLEKKESADKIKAATQKMLEASAKGKSIKWKNAEEEAAYEKKYADPIFQVHMRTTGAANSEGGLVVQEIMDIDAMKEKDFERKRKEAMKGTSADPAKKGK